MTGSQRTHRLPSWLKATAPGSRSYVELKSLVNRLSLHTVCQSARCPNMGECWGQRTATFMILGNTCTRSCGFCAIATGQPAPVDEEEPDRVSQAVAALQLRHAVITSVTRDDLPDGGAAIFARTIRALHERCPETTVEILIPDFGGDRTALAVVLDAGPHILNHNVETVPRLYAQMRPQARYRRSLELLDRARALSPAATKSGVMLGVGEQPEEVGTVIEDLRSAGCQILTLGQYLSPSDAHVPVHRYVTPIEFDEWRRYALARGFRHVESGPLVRSSYHAALQLDQASVAATSNRKNPDPAVRTDPATRAPLP